MHFIFLYPVSVQDSCQSCPSGGYARVAPAVRSGYIASVLTAETVSLETCGSAQCPWLIAVQPGQRINLTLYDYSPTTVTQVGWRDLAGLCWSLECEGEFGVCVRCVFVWSCVFFVDLSRFVGQWTLLGFVGFVKHCWTELELNIGLCWTLLDVVALVEICLKLFKILWNWSDFVRLCEILLHFVVLCCIFVALC